MFKIKSTKIRVRLLAVFAVILLLSFSFTGVIFNIAVRRYIQTSAVTQIEMTHNNILQAIEQSEVFVFRQPDGITPFRLPESFFEERFPFLTRRNSYRISSNVFIVDTDYNLYENQEKNEETYEIAKAAKDTKIPISNLRNMLIRTGSGIYYVSSFPMTGNQVRDSSYFIIYADVTGLLLFAASINTFLILLVCMMFAVTVFLTYFLSNTITHPINKLVKFASRIGQGDFTPSNFTFIDEEFESLNNALNNSAKQLNVYDSEQKEFFQNVSHELRTPLMSIQCQAEGISFGIMEPKKAIETILQEINRLSQMVTDLLYISKIDNITTVYNYSKVDLVNTLRSCAQRHQTLADKKGIRFSFEFNEPVVEYDCVEELISRAFDNLITNAIRYASSQIDISCKKEKQQIVISIQDDGDGIENENFPYIFERFYKGSDGNHGIGLSIVKSIIEQHNGIITAKNTEKHGALFTITLPITRK